MPQDSLVPSNSRSIDFDGGYPIPGVDLYPQTIRPGVFRSESSESTKDEKLDNYNPFTPNQPYNDGLKIPTVLNLLEEQAKQYFELYGNSATTAQGFCNTYRNTLVYSDYLTNYCVYIDSYVQNSD
uniref:Uncharacterized protein n=1 Tax=Strongyloides stercoralis TaxID=6248 RepID=A0AAF5DKL4_STRER